VQSQEGGKGERDDAEEILNNLRKEETMVVRIHLNGCRAPPRPTG